MRSRTVSLAAPRWLAAASAIVVVLLPLVSTAHAAVFRSSGSSTADRYEEQIAGSGTLEGDVWGGEQTPAADTRGTTDPDVPVVSTLSSTVSSSRLAPATSPWWWNWIRAWSGLWNFLSR